MTASDKRGADAAVPAVRAHEHVAEVPPARVHPARPGHPPELVQRRHPDRLAGKLGEPDRAAIAFLRDPLGQVALEVGVLSGSGSGSPSGRRPGQTERRDRVDVGAPATRMARSSEHGHDVLARWGNGDPSPADAAEPQSIPEVHSPAINRGYITQNGGILPPRWSRSICSTTTCSRTTSRGRCSSSSSARRRSTATPSPTAAASGRSPSTTTCSRCCATRRRTPRRSAAPRRSRTCPRTCSPRGGTSSSSTRPSTAATAG